ncbi:DNA phosphorothioation-dependent restriction protein DptG [Halorubellus salinus]|uniref:DNA phosphorothioation-dependent restriction protein DptG n=1 Tax=Halorubellus salinus TaxID=755309 RepID=UPI001D07F7DA|nr:DNA phosphorothioation-dependent restriction protein DptG [Halorubellus salinus]
MSDEIQLTGQVPRRTIDGGIFPFSARANAREGIFSDVLAAVLQCDPEVAITEETKDTTFDWANTTLKQRFNNVIDGDYSQETNLDVTPSVNSEDVWEIFEAKYTALTQGDNPIVVPFNPAIPKRIRPVNSNKWGSWYRLLMTEKQGESLEFDPDGLHADFRKRLDNLEASNIFEQAIVSVVETFDEPTKDTAEATVPLRPYIDEMAENFRVDLKAWLANDVESASDWLRGSQDLIGIHFFMYYVQVALNLRKEWSKFINGEEYSPKIIGVPFGIESESAGLGREFVKIWKGERGAEYSVRRDIYDSFARLAVLRMLNEAISEHDHGPDYPVTLTEALDVMDDKSRQTAIEEIYDSLDADSPDDCLESTLIEASQKLVKAIDKRYQGADDSAPFSMGVRGVKNLADADVRFLSREAGRPSYRFQMADETLAFLARVFACDEERTDEELALTRFNSYLVERGFHLDERSKTAAKASLTSMGLLSQESDSGDSVNVRTY